MTGNTTDDGLEEVNKLASQIDQLFAQSKQDIRTCFAAMFMLVIHSMRQAPDSSRGLVAKQLRKLADEIE